MFGSMKSEKARNRRTHEVREVALSWKSRSSEDAKSGKPRPEPSLDLQKIVRDRPHELFQARHPQPGDGVPGYTSTSMLITRPQSLQQVHQI